MISVSLFLAAASQLHAQPRPDETGRPGGDRAPAGRPGDDRAPAGRPEAKPQEVYRDQIVAEVEREPITLSELERAARLTLEYRNLKDSQPGNVGALRQSLQRHLDQLIDERILLLQCAKEKITLSKEDEQRVQREVDRDAEPHRGIEALKATLQKIGVPFEFYVERKRSNVLVTKLLLKNVSRDIYVEPERLRKFYEEHKREKFRREAVRKFYQVDVFHDLGGARVPDAVKSQEKSWGVEPARAFAEAIRARAKDHVAEWREIAQSSTMNTSMVADAGLVKVEGTAPLASQMGELGEVADQLKEGEVSSVIRTKQGFHVIFMKERSNADVLPFSEVQKQIADTLRTEIWQERLKAYIKRIKDEIQIRTYLPSE